MASLFQACKAAVRNKQGGTFSIGGYDIDIELYHQQDINNDVTYGDVAFGDNDESKIVLVADDTITIPSGYTLTPDKPKKSLVIYCNTLINNGTISMYKKAPNVLPHDYYIIQGSIINSNRDIVIPAYADNGVPSQKLSQGICVNGNNGTNRQCGSGGTGAVKWWMSTAGTNTVGSTGSGYAFGGGAGSGCIINGPNNVGNNVDSVYPMRGSDWGGDTTKMGNGQGGCGNPTGASSDSSQLFTGCGGRIIIFCASFKNSGNLTVNGTSSNNSSYPGGASGAGAIDVFYTTMVTQGTMTATGGTGATFNSGKSGNGGNGSITLTQWNFNKVIKDERKIFTKDNWVYLFTEYTARLREDVI